MYQLLFSLNLPWLHAISASALVPARLLMPLLFRQCSQISVCPNSARAGKNGVSHREMQRLRRTLPVEHLLGHDLPRAMAAKRLDALGTRTLSFSF